MCARSWYFDDNAVGLHSSISDNEKQSNLTRQRIFPTSLNTKHGQCSYWEFPYINMFVGYLSVITNLRKTNSNLCFVIYFALIWNVNLTSAIFRGLYSVLHSFLKNDWERKKTYRNTWLHHQNTPNDRCKRRNPQCWNNWRQHGSCFQGDDNHQISVRGNTRPHLKENNWKLNNIPISITYS